MEQILEKYLTSVKVDSLVKKITDNRNRCCIKGVTGSSLAFVSTATIRKTKEFTHVFMFADKQRAAYFFNDLENLFDDQSLEYSKKQVLFYPASFNHDKDVERTQNANVVLRSAVLERLADNTAKIIVTYPQGFCEKVVSKKTLQNRMIKISDKDKTSIDFLIDVFDDFGFERVDMVTEAGQYSIRGGIVDVFSFSEEMPFRIEFFGDDIESLRTFDIATQLSVEEKRELKIMPNFSSVTVEKKVSLADYFDSSSIVWIEQSDMFLSKVAKLEEENRDKEMFLAKEEFIKVIKPLSTVFVGDDFSGKSNDCIVFNTEPQPSFNGNFELLTNTLIDKQEHSYDTYFGVLDSNQKDRINKIVDEFAEGKNILPLKFIQKSFEQGFIDNDESLLFFTDHQLFNRYHKYKIRDGKSQQEKLTMEELLSLKPGDYVTHIDYGVGKFAGLEKIDNNGRKQEAIRLVYKDNDILYVSIHALHKISRYVGKEGTEPKLNRLGSNTWNNLKNKTKQRVKDIAKELIALYARRKASVGFAFSADTYLQHELEASFMYEDTPDQYKATRAVKQDMESSHPMDRLICGDVGFGKTEVAIRAAFKAVCDGKQVAVLVPTTILAFQHWKTFSERLKDMPCNIDYLNRFRSAKEKKQVLDDLAQGKTDILIGTHIIVGKDVKFKDLGLLIIDEEHKFGVAIKEKLKKLKVNIDTLTLTATPIPRTLQFSLMGARDLSIINTPPPNRQPVETEVTVFNEELIRDAIMFELSRGGQVYFVHNRVQNIMEISALISRLVPDARVVVGHGQMKGEELEEIMMDFIEGRYDILVSTTIVENGLDIPNANTMFINDAQNYGLSDLHQLRGRVGRSNKKAFCYLIAPDISLLTPEAGKRLKAIEEFSAIGSGFSIAMRDLDIRGAGNILGAEQSGFISEIGFEMYHKILDEAIEELKTTEFRDLFAESLAEREYYVKDCVIETDLEILIPDTYISNVVERLKIYKQLDGMENESELENLKRELTDRFGKIPKETTDLFEIVSLRSLAKKTAVEKLSIKRGKMSAVFVSDKNSPFFSSELFANLIKYIQMYPQKCSLQETDDKLVFNVAGITDIYKAVKVFRDITA